MTLSVDLQFRGKKKLRQKVYNSLERRFTKFYSGRSQILCLKEPFRTKNLNNDPFAQLESELQNIHSKKFENLSVEGALTQLEVIYLGLKTLFIQVKKAFFKQKADVFEIQIATSELRFLEEGKLVIA